MQGARTTRTSRPSLRRQVAQQVLGARHRAGERVAHAHRDGRRRRLAFLHDVEMRVEGRDLVDLGQRELHLLRRARRDARRRDGRSGPGSGADARSAGRAGAARSPSSARTSSSACGSTWRPLGVRAGLRRPLAGLSITSLIARLLVRYRGAEISPTRLRPISPARPIWRFRSRRTWRDSPATCGRARPDRYRCPSAAAALPACSRPRRWHH